MDQLDEKMLYVRHYFESIDSLPEVAWQALKGKLSLRAYVVGDLFQRPSEPPRLLGLVLSGLFRIYYSNRQNKEFTRAFSSEFMLLGDYANALRGQASNVTIEAIENSLVAEIAFPDFVALFDQYPCWDRLGRKIVEFYYIERERREAEIAMFTALERYENFILTHPNIEMRTTNVQVASYLRITPETLSRLKRMRKGSS